LIAISPPPYVFGSRPVIFPRIKDDLTSGYTDLLTSATTRVRFNSNCMNVNTLHWSGAWCSITLIMQHFGLGFEIRNLLRAGGFAWSDTALDREWGPILFEAIRTVV
jgi:hypothetical protein